MRRAFFTASFIMLTASLVCAQMNFLPFAVKIGGQEAVMADAGANHAVIKEPVAADAPLEIAASGMAILNIVKSDAKGQPATSAQPVIIIANDGKSSLDKSMDQQKLAAGTYLMNAVAAGKTARVVFTVE